ncbi:hypothetical protein SDC9_211210 [bioreactor metagenome]|uniref:Uncharacterized protein n=1 Tax=bioreactor metagenome TaxID=1076179 RepID=A0A645JIL6_9ZZZZ
MLAGFLRSKKTTNPAKNTLINKRTTIKYANIVKTCVCMKVAPFDTQAPCSILYSSRHMQDMFHLKKVNFSFFLLP